MQGFNLTAKEFESLQESVLRGDSHRKRSQEKNDLDMLSLSEYKYRRPEQQGFMGDVVDSFQMGAWQGAGALARGVGTIFDSDWFNEVADWAGKKADENRETMSDEMRSALEQSAFDGYDSTTGEGKGVLNAYWWAGNLGALIGEQLDTVATLGVGKLATAGIKTAGKFAGKYLSKEAVEKVGEVAVKEAAKRGVPPKYLNAIGVTAAISAMSAGHRASQAYDEVEQLGVEELKNIDRFKEIHLGLIESGEAEGLSDKELFFKAKQLFKNQAGRSAARDPVAILADLSTNAVSGLGGGFLGVLNPAKTVKGGLAKGALTESITEGLQGAAEQYAINDTAKTLYDKNRELTEGMQRNVVDGMVLGGVFGGVMGGIDSLSHKRQQRKLLEPIETGNPVIDEGLKHNAEMINQFNNDLDESVLAKNNQTNSVQMNSSNVQAKQEVESISPEDFHTQPFERVFTQFKQDGLDDNDISQYISENISLAQNKLNELKANPFKITADYRQNIVGKKQYQSEIENAESQLNYWQEALNKLNGNSQEQINQNTLQNEGMSTNLNQETREINNADNLENGLDPVTYEDLSNEPSFPHNPERVWKGKKNGAPFNSEAEAERSDAYKRAEELRLNPTVIEKDDGVFLVEIDNQDDVKFSRSFNDSGYVNDLIVTHNISDQGILHANKMGGLPFPSVAITKNSNPLESFGDVTLIGDRNYIDPKGENKAKVFGSDIYSPRYPKVTYQINNKDIEKLSNLFNQSAQEVKDYKFQDLKFALKDNGIEKTLAQSMAVKYQFLKDNGINVELAYKTPETSEFLSFNAVKSYLTPDKIEELRGNDRFAIELAKENKEKLEHRLETIKFNRPKIFLRKQIQEMQDIISSNDPSFKARFLIDEIIDSYNSQSKGGLDQTKTSDNINSLISHYEPQFKQYVENITSQIPYNEQLYNGTDRNGRDRYISHSLENVVKKLKKDLRGGESFNYGVPTLRASLTPKFNSIENIQKNKSRLVNKDEFQKIKTEIDNDLTALSDQLGISYQKALNVLHNSVNGNISEALNNERISNTIGNQQAVSNMLEKLKSMPTEYFEGKAKDITQFSDFRGAVIPKTLSPEARAILENAGLSLYEYDSSIENNRKDVIKQASIELNDKHNNILFSRLKQDRADITTHPHLEETKANLSKILGRHLSKHFDVVNGADLGIDDPTIEAGYNPKTGKIFIVADNIKGNNVLSREERLTWVAFHELAHRGLSVRFGGDFRNLMTNIDKNTTINKLATAIQEQRSETRGNRLLAVEEALAELNAAYTTGKLDELKSRYNIEIKPHYEKGLKGWFKMTAQHIREFINRLFGKETADKFSDNDLINLLSDINKSAGGKLETNENINAQRFSLNEDPDSRFARAVDIVTQGGKPSQQYIPVGTTPNVLKMLGIADTGVFIHRDVLNKVMGGKHNITPEILKQLPKQINNPVAVMKSAPQATKQGYVVLTELIEKSTLGKNEPVISALHLVRSNQGIELINIASVYGKNLNGLQNMLNHDLIYWNKTKGSNLVKAFGLQLPAKIRLNNSNLSVGNIKTETDLSQYQNEKNIRYSRTQGKKLSALEISRGGNIPSEPKWWENFTSREQLIKTMEKSAAKLDEWLADSLRPVNDWIDEMEFSDATGNTSSRDHEKRRLKDSMYTAKGKRDALNSQLEKDYLKPILSKIAKIAKNSNGKINEETAKKKVGLWVSVRYSIEKNTELLKADENAVLEAKQALSEAQVQGIEKDITQAQKDLEKAYQQYQGRKEDIENNDFKNKQFKVGVAGGWSIPEAKEIMHNIEAVIPVKALEEVGELIADLNQARLSIDYQSGRYTEQEYLTFRENRHYVPLTGDPRAELDDIDFIGGAGANSLNVGKDKSLEGRKNSEAEDAIDAIWKATGKTTTYAGWSEFKQRIDDLYETEVALLKDKGYTDKDAHLQAKNNIGISKQKMQGLTRTSDDVLIAKQGGAYYEYKLPNEVMNALKNDNIESANAFLKVLSKPTSWYARGVTQWTVTFAPMNMARDTWEKSEFIRVQKIYDKNGKLLDSATMDKIGRGVIKNALNVLDNDTKGVWSAVKRFGFGQELRDNVDSERLLKQLLKDGGVSNYGTYLDRTETDLIQKLKRENNPLANKLEKVGSVLEGYNKMFDTVSALSAYKSLIDNGVDSKQAAAVTLELTNFRKTGSKMRGIKAIYMFSQPTVMGAANLIRYLSTRKGQVRFAGYMAVMIPLYAALRSFSDEDEGGNKMDQLGDITRYIPIPVGDNYIKIPVGFGMPQMAWNFATNIVKTGGSDISFTEAGVNMLAHSMKTFAPVSPSEISAAKFPLTKITLTATPTILQPLMQNVVDRSAFGSKIKPNFVRDDKLKAEQSKSTTAQFWKDVAIEIQQNLGIDMHPEEIKNVFDGYSAMFGSLRELSTIFVENPNRELLGRNTRMPLVNQIFGAGNEFAIQSRYYEASEETKNLTNEYNYRKANNKLNGWLTPEKRKIILFHQKNKRQTAQLRSYKAKLTKELRAGRISAITYENRLKEYNKATSQLQGRILREYRKMMGLNTH